MLKQEEQAPMTTGRRSARKAGAALFICCSAMCAWVSEWPGVLLAPLGILTPILSFAALETNRGAAGTWRARALWVTLYAAMAVGCVEPGGGVVFFGLLAGVLWSRYERLPGFREPYDPEKHWPPRW